jgi:hypothetical protein
MRQHQRALKKVSEAGQSSSATKQQGRSHLRLFGSGGALEKIMRNTYREGLAKLNCNSFESKEAKAEWQSFVDELTPEEMALVTNEHWM